MKTLSAWVQAPKHRAIAAISLIFILLPAVCLYQAFLSPLKEGICIGGVEAGGLSPVRARQVLESALENALLKQELPVHLPEETLTLSPEDCGLHVRVGRALLAARHAKAHTQISLLPYLKAEEDIILNKLQTYAAKYDTALTQPAWHLEGEAQPLSTDLFSPNTPGQSLVLTLGLPEQHLDCEAALPVILQAFSDAVTLTKTDQYSAAPVIIPSELPETADAAAIAKQYCCDPVNDRVNRETYSLVPGAYGTCLDADLLAEKIRQGEYGETIRIPLEYIPPEVLGDEAYFTDVLGAFETRHTNDKNRNHNLQLQCDTLNDFVLQPGETFSMNEVLGERTVERGYKPAPAYSGKRLVNSPGGGVCQGSTTLYNCVLLADLEVIFRACHGAKVGYVPLGLDAAINYLTTDFQFRNNFNCPIQIKAWMEDGYMKMQILGTDEKDYYIKMETGSGEDEIAWYARSFKCKYDKETHELISREVEAYSTYYKSIE